MDENPKKGGARDISDLKARLGLKKGGTAMPSAQQGTPAAVPGVGAGTPAAVGSVPPPAGVRPSVPAPFPPPPGFPVAAAPEPAAPPPPDPRRDPFAAQQQARAVYYVQETLPGSDDGKAVAPIERKKPWGRYGAIAGAVLVMFAAGYGCGRIYEGRHNYNQTTEQAGQIRDEVEKMAKNLNAINDKLNASQNLAKGQPDVQLAEDLGTLDLKRPDQQKIFRTNYMYLPDLDIERLFNYYNDSIILYDLITKHKKKTEADKEAIENFVKSGAGKADKNYGIVIDATGGIPLAQFVELGSPVCAQEGETDCKTSELKGFKYRTDSGGSWSQKPVKGKLESAVIPIQRNPFFTAVASGSPDILAVKDHMRRMAEIRLLSAKLGNDQKALVAGLKTAADREKMFTF